jgi:hypothetical protein
MRLSFYSTRFITIFAYTTDCAYYRVVIPPVGRVKNFLFVTDKLNDDGGFTGLRF